MTSANAARLPDDEAMERYIDAAAAVVGLKIDPLWREPVLVHLRTISQAAKFVEGYALPDDLTSAPVFEA